MEGGSVKLYTALRGYRKRKGYTYQRLSTSGRRTRVVRLGSGRRRRFFWRFKAKPLVKLLRPPKNFFLWLRDAYVKMMMGFAGSRVCSVGYGGSAADIGISELGKRRLKEYDQKLIVEIYKSLMVAQGQFMVREAADLRSAVTTEVAPCTGQQLLCRK